MNAPLGTLDTDTFLAEYWQRKPCLIRQAIPDLAFPLDGNDLAGLACETDVEARLVTGTEETGWSLRHGPFTEDDFLGLPDRNWTLPLWYSTTLSHSYNRYRNRNRHKKNGSREENGQNPDS